MIEGYEAKINRKALGFTMMVVVQISLESQNEDLLVAFEAGGFGGAVHRVLLHDVGPGRLSDHRCWREISRISSGSIRSSFRGSPASRGSHSSFVLREVTSRSLPGSSLLR